ncbi:MAG: AAA family ATPase, partial [Snowella sp.]
MIQEITIENYKSIQSLSIELGRVTVFIGENGCGKSNILEAIALGSAAAADKLDNEFLASRGIRVTDPKLMRSAFEIENLDKEIKIIFKGINNKKIFYSLNHSNDFYSSWLSKDYITSELETLSQEMEVVSQEIERKNLQNATLILIKSLHGNTYKKMKNVEKKLVKVDNLLDIEAKYIWNFFVFCLEFTKLKEFSKEGQIEPLGIKGEGLFKYLRYLSQPQFKEKLDQVKEKLELIDWFEDFDIPDNLYPGEKTLKIKDRYLDPDLEYFDQKSANEGFLFLLFYFCLFIGEETPKFFAIDNIDSSLNPRLCRRLIQELVELAKKYDKQV